MMAQPTDERFHRAMAAAGSMLWDWDISSGSMWYSPTLRAVLGYAGDESFAPTDHEFMAAVHPEDQPRLREALATAFRGRAAFASEYRLRHRSGEFRWYLAEGEPGFGPDGRARHVSGALSDIHERRRAEEALERERTRAVVTLDSISEAVVSTDATGRIEFLNAAAEKMLGMSGQALHGQVFATAVALVDAAQNTPVPDPALACLAAGRAVHGRDAVLRTTGDEEVLIEYSATALLGTGTAATGAVVVMRNVTEERRLVQAIRHQATHDSLTGLVNRPEFERRLQRVLQSPDDTARHALCYLDLDQFKVINDTCGHTAGDELLRQVGVILRGSVRKRDTVARLGGDEFAILMEHCTLPQANRVAREVREKIAEYRFRWNEHVFGLGVSIGLVQITESSGSMASLMKQADTACYAAKEHGRNRVHVYDPGDVTVERRQGEMLWVSRITAALEERRFTLLAQPALPRPGSGGEEYVEILLRYPDDGGVATPDEFLPAAERYSLSPRIDREVVGMVLDWYARHRSLLDPRTIIAVNLSALSLTDETLLDYIQTECTHLSLPFDRFCFEVTETAAIGNMARALHFFQTLRARGCRFALDDFGSGLSSFGYLRSLPVDFLKIDGVFVRDCVKDPVDMAMVRSINDIGHVMGIRTIAEFVETPEVAAKVVTLDVDYLQGYGICRPLALDEYLRRVVHARSRAQ
jgi:diguanylate cyclase (GGDEF)-like protein/PAS domain S-box-containing protein